MCGIAGYFSTTSFFNTAHLPSMANAIAHRGPNNESFYTTSKVGLAHRRLSVLDLSATANQPMWSACKRYVIVYNGEVYNFKTIAQQLQRKLGNALQLTTTGDTEIVLQAIITFGFEVVATFNGMFAFALYDTQLEQLHIYRDKLGIKPLYYYWDNNNLAFASELKAITVLPNVAKEISTQAIAEFLHLGFIPAPHSIYNSIFKLEAGHCITISATSFTQKAYTTLTTEINSTTLTNEPQALQTLDSLLTNAVQLQLQSDVPCGVLLSGGTDSSLIAAIAQKNSSTPIQTFSIGFNEKQYNEALHAKQVAAHIGTQHNELIVSQKEALPVIQTMQDIYDEPYADTSAIPTLFVAQFARKQVTVALSGEGADELFHGYGAYKWASRLNTTVAKNANNLIAQALQLGNSRYKRVAKLFDYNNYAQQIRSHIYSQEQYNFSANDLLTLLTASYQHYNFNTLNTITTTALHRTLTPAELQAYFDITIPLQDDLLTKVDRATMHYGLEARVPFLDNDVVNFALNLSPHLKIKNGTQKYLLKQVLYNYVPQTLMQRPKQGFALPLPMWLKQDLYFMINDYLSQDAVQKAGMLNYPQVQQIVKQFMTNDPTLFRRVWLMIVLQKWILTPTNLLKP